MNKMSDNKKETSHSSSEGSSKQEKSTTKESPFKEPRMEIRKIRNEGLDKTEKDE